MSETAYPQISYLDIRDQDKKRKDQTRPWETADVYIPYSVLQKYKKWVIGGEWPQQNLDPLAQQAGL